jgi:hypothetical protein
MLLTMFCIKFRRRSFAVRLLVVVPLVYFVYFIIISIATSSLTTSNRHIPNMNADLDDLAYPAPHDIVNPNINVPNLIGDDSQRKHVVVDTNNDEEFKDYHQIKVNGALGTTREFEIVC